MPELRVTITVDGSARSTVHTKATDVGPREAEALARKALTALATEVAAMDRCPFHQAAPPIGAAGEAEAALSATDELIARLRANDDPYGHAGCANCDELLKSEAASALSRLLAERREMLEALKLARVTVASKVETERYLARKAERAGEYTPDPADTHKSAAVKALDAIDAALSALPEGKGES